MIPLYNKEREIGRAIQSVLSQEVRPRELIVVDDGSTDGSAGVVSAVRAPMVRLVSQANKGVSAARNRGVAEAVCGAVAFLDADDEWRPGFIGAVMDLRGRCPDAGMWATAFDLGRGGRHECMRTRWKGVPAAAEGGIIPDFFRSSMKMPPFCASSFCVPVGVFGSVGGFPEGVALGEDMVLWVRIALRYQIAYSPSAQAVYHKDASNRAMDRHRYGGRDTLLARVMEDALETGTLPPGLRRSARLFLAQHLLEVARHAGDRGDGELARRLLREVLLRHRAFPLRCLRRWIRSYRAQAGAGQRPGTDGGPVPPRP